MWEIRVRSGRDDSCVVPAKASARNIFAAAIELSSRPERILFPQGLKS
jgi:hypothetical protein